LNVTAVAPLRFVPLIVTLAPTGPLVGEKLVIVGGAGTTVNALALVALPPGVVTLSVPVVAPAGTVAWMAVSEVTEKFAPRTGSREGSWSSPLKVTPVAPVKFVPLIVTLAPTGPLVGEKLVIVGGGTTVNELALTAVPPDPTPGAFWNVVTRSGPVVAPAGTVAWIDVSEDTVKLALLPLNHTDVAPVKFAPLMVTLVPTGPLVGAKPLIVGDCTTVNALALVAVPADVVTRSGPVLAVAQGGDGHVAPGTTVAIDVSEATVKLALVPLNVTAVAPVKFVPVIVTLLPTGPLVGVKLVIVGGGTTVNALALVTVPPGVVTLSGPVVAPAGAVAWIEVSETTE
jgi:hypothetical protein